MVEHENLVVAHQAKIRQAQIVHGLQRLVLFEISKQVVTQVTDDAAFEQTAAFAMARDDVQQLVSIVDYAFGIDHQQAIAWITQKEFAAEPARVTRMTNGICNEVYVVEVKSTLREEGLEQMLRILREFHDFFSGHRGKKLYGILAAVNVPDNVRNKVLKAGIYLARIHDESFEISVPESFQPRAY